jgi:hypothetical protein
MTTFSNVDIKETLLLSSNRVIKKDLGEYPEDIFSNFSKTPIASGASTITSHQLFSILIANRNPTSFVNTGCSSIDEDSHPYARSCAGNKSRPHPLTPRLPASHLVLKLPILTTLQ